MTEDEWLACDDPLLMLIHLRGEVSPQEQGVRRSWLYTGAGQLHEGPSPFVPQARFPRWVAACAARLRQLPIDEPTSRYLDCFQRYAEGKATRDDLRGLWWAMRDGKSEGQYTAVDYLMSWGDTPCGAGSACAPIAAHIAYTVAKDSIAVTCAGATDDDWLKWGICGVPDPLYQATLAAEFRAQAELLREVIGNPFRPVALPTGWRDWEGGVIVRLAQEVAEESAFDWLRFLADALEKAGCTDVCLLEHCRRPGGHVRGCWAVDLLREGA
jgi:hypothetical protein